MKTALYSLAVCAFGIVPLRGDLTIVYSTTVEPARQAQKEQTTPTAVDAAANMTIRVKGDKARIDAPPHVTAIFNGTTGELINLLNDQKTMIRTPPEKMRAIADTLNKLGNNKGGSQKSVLTPTGQKEVIDGYDTDRYTYDGPNFKATYWIAPNYPNGAAALEQLQSIKSELWDAANTKMPDFRNFPGLPIQMRVIVGKETAAAGHDVHASAHPTEITSSVSSVSLASIPDSEFTAPADFKEANVPDVFNNNAAPSPPPNR
jgi:hypothetical protein